jgi:translocator protein
MKKLKKPIALGVFLFICFGSAYVGSILTNLSVNDWYPGLIKPSWTPSGASIGAVWSVLYILIAVSAWLVWCKSEGERRRAALAVFAVQLILNVTWSALFFGLRSPGLASLEIIALLASIAVTARIFYSISKVAGILMTPYLLWVGFAATLNWTIWYLNSGSR